MKSALEKFKSWSWESRLLLILTIMALIPSFVGLWQPARGPDAPAESVDTHIPRGFVLIPIEVHNYEALDSLFGRFGLVDLFIPAENGSPQRLVAVNVRLLRAPQNPTRFAVLVPERESSKILAHAGAYVVSIKPPSATGTEFVKSERAPRRKIVYGGF
jgi:hypothetical protein